MDLRPEKLGRERDERATRSADGFEAWREIARGNTACERAVEEVEAIEDEDLKNLRQTITDVFWYCFQRNDL